jgi:hypothetical protein
LGLLVSGSASAASISYFLDQSNALPNGTNYLQVTIADGVAGDINVSVALLAPLTSIADANFGIQAFSFNSTNVLGPANILGAPGGWIVSTDYDPQGPHLTADGFGRFQVELADGGQFRQSPILSFSISIAGDSINDYAVLSTNSGRGPTFFGAHVTGFVDQDPGDGILTSGWFGGTTVVPEPSTASLLGLSLGLLAWMRRRATA